MKTTINIFQSFIKPQNRDSENLKKEFTRSQRALRNLEPIELKVSETLTSVIDVKELDEIPTDLKTLWEFIKDIEEKR